MRLIDADALNIYDVSPAYGMTVMGVTEEDIDDAPTIEIPTLYGYNIENLAMIARVMQKEGVTPEDAIVIFRDVRYMYKMLLEEIQEGFEKAFMKED